MLLRIGVVPIEDVLPYVSIQGKPPHGQPESHPGRPFRLYHEKKIFLDSLRYQTFVKSGTQCVVCGLQASFFAVERHHTHNEERYHLNLYGTKKGQEVLFTKDHIIPRSKGGKDHLDNFQTMCSPCNDMKGNHNNHKGLDPVKVRGRYLARLRGITSRLELRLAAIRQKGRELYQKDSLDGGPEHTAYHLSQDQRKKVWKNRIYRLQQELARLNKGIEPEVGGDEPSDDKSPSNKH